MNTQLSHYKSRRPLYKRKGFWLAVAAATLLAAGVAAFFFTKPYAVKPAADTKTAKTGRVEIYTSPKGAAIILDGQQRHEKSPAKFSAPLGKHTVTLTLKDYDTATIPIDVVTANPAIIQQTFTKQGKITTTEPPSQFKTYTNATYHYRIRYPGSWKPQSGSPEVVNFVNQNQAAPPGGAAPGEDQTTLSVLTQPNPGNLTPAEWYKARPEYSQEDQSQIKTRELTINGRPAFQFETPYGFVPYVNTAVTGNGQAFIMQQAQGSPERATYDQVIQTFSLF